MKDSYSDDRTGWARFSDDETMRYRLARSLLPGVSVTVTGDKVALEGHPDAKRTVFLMCNPSTADAFKLDKTVNKCGQFAELWGVQIYEVVNLYALRSPYPTDLDVAITKGEPIGINRAADEEILAACLGAGRVIAAWGNNGHRLGRAVHVRQFLRDHDIKLEHFGFTKEGYPLHPLARGKSWVPLDRVPQVWA